MLHRTVEWMNVSMSISHVSYLNKHNNNNSNNNNNDNNLYLKRLQTLIYFTM